MRYMIVCRQDENTLSVGRQVRNKLDEAGWQHTESDPQLVICIGGGRNFALRAFINIWIRSMN